jgi:hypothetical protein
VAEKFQEGREGKYRAGIRENGLQGVIPYLARRGVYTKTFTGTLDHICLWCRVQMRLYGALSRATPTRGSSDGVEGTIRGSPAQMFIYLSIYLKPRTRSFHAGL